MDQQVMVKIKHLEHAEPGENPLEYATPNSAGVDLRAWPKDTQVSLPPGERYPFPTGIALEITKAGVAGFIFSRSGLGTKQGLVVSQGVGVIDPDYRGEIIVSLLNNSLESRTVSRGQRIAQLIFMPWVQAKFQVAQELSSTERGSGGFGHTGN